MTRTPGKPPVICTPRKGYRLNRGFSLIELMVVISIIAILALIAIPTLMEKIVRDQIIEALPLADLATRPIAAGWAITKTFPSDNAAAGLPDANKLVIDPAR